jgi:hypothetical protein
MVEDGATFMKKMELHMKKMHGSFVMVNKRMAKELFKAEDGE